MIKQGSQNYLLIEALKKSPAGLTALQLSKITGSTAVATRVSECRKHGYKIKNLSLGKKERPVYILHGDRNA